jgi:ABC-type spermidine/putrescine transport system permease subunit II
MQNNPSLVVGAISAAVGAIFSLLLAYGVAVSADQQAAWLNAVVVFTPLIVGGVNWYLNRRRSQARSVEPPR